MEDYKIGILDDSYEDLCRVKRTIFSHLRDKAKYVGYDASMKSEELMNDVLEDIMEFKISILLVDSKLINNDCIFNGGDIYSKIKSLSPDFPIVLITNFVDEAVEKSCVDPDKIYDKGLFFAGGNYTDEKILSITKNIAYYNNMRGAAQARVEQSIKNYKKNKNDEDKPKIIKELLDNEEEYNKFIPCNQVYLEKIISTKKIQDIVDLIDKIDDKLE